MVDDVLQFKLSSDDFPDISHSDLLTNFKLAWTVLIEQENLLQQVVSHTSQLRVSWVIVVRGDRYAIVRLQCEGKQLVVDNDDL